MKRDRIVQAFFVSAIFGALQLPASSAVVAESSVRQGHQVSQSNLLGPPLHVQLVDAYSGEPIVGAPIQAIGIPQIKTTNAQGWVVFRRPGGQIGDAITLWTTPSTHAPASRRLTLTSTVNFVTIYTPPLNTFSTGLIDPQQGGHFVFDTALPTPVPTPFHIELTVPPGALPQALDIHLTPYPPHALWYHGIPANSILFGAVHVNVTDSAGQSATEVLSLPVTFRARGYAAGGNLAAYDLSTLRLFRYDYVAHQWTNDSAPIAIDLNTNTFTVQTNHFSILSGCSEPQSQTTEPLPSFGVTEQGHKCENKCDVPVTCGIHNGSCSITAGEGSQVSFSETIASTLNAEFGETVGNDLLGKISAKVGVSVSGSVATSLTGTTSKTVTGSVQQGGPAGGGDCFSGWDSLYLVSKIYKVTVAGMVIGEITVPEKVQIVPTRHADFACCELPGPLPQMPYLPDDCQ